MRSAVLQGKNPGVLAAGLALALLIGVADSHVYAQQPSTTAGAAWYRYVPGRGWEGYYPASLPNPTPVSARSAPSAGSVAATSFAPGWAGYQPALAWTGYAPASSPLAPNVVTTPSAMYLSSARAERRAAYLFVNGEAPGLAFAESAYREMGSGRNVPLAKPWLPPSP